MISTVMLAWPKDNCKSKRKLSGARRIGQRGGHGVCPEVAISC